MIMTASPAIPENQPIIHHRLRHPVLSVMLQIGVACLIGGAIISQPASAQDDQINLTETDTTLFVIPAGPLQQALDRFARRAGVNLTYDAAILQGLTTQGINGRFTTSEALERLLANSNLQAISQSAGGYRLTPKNSVDSTSLTLPTVNVSATEINGLPGAYAGGQVARGGRVGLLGNKDVLDTPFNITNYTAQAIEDWQSRTLADVLSNDPSVRATTSAGHSMETFRIRGFDLWMGDLAFNGLYGVAPDGHATTELFERIEVLRGPSALLNGMAPGGSVGGTVNLVPKRAGDTPLTRLTGTYAAESNFGAHVDVSRRFGAQQEFGVRFNGVVADGRTGVDGQSKDRELSALALDYQGNRLRASLDAYLSDDEQRGGSNFMTGFASYVPRAPDGDTNIYRGATNSIENKALVGRVEYDVTDYWSAYAAAGRRLHRYAGTTRGTSVIVQPNGDFAGVHRNYRGYSDTDTAEAGLRGNIWTGSILHELVFSISALTIENGLSYSSPSSIASNIYNPLVPELAESAGRVPKTGESTLTSYAFADTLSLLDERIFLTLGLRNQRVRSESFNSLGGSTSRYDESALTPAVGLVLKPWQSSVSLYANYIEGLSQGSTVTDVSASNFQEVFAPYKSKQVEVGLKWDAGQFINSVSLFQITKPSLIRNASTSVYSDDGEQRNRGVEWMVAGELAPGMRLLGGMSYTQATLTRTADGMLDGQSAFGVPKWTGNIGAEWDAPWLQGLTLTSRVTYTDEQYLNSTNTQQLPSYTVADIGARYAIQLSGRDVLLRASINNVFDRRYWQGGFGDGYAQVGAGRQLLLSATVDF